MIAEFSAPAGCSWERGALMSAAQRRAGDQGSDGLMQTLGRSLKQRPLKLLLMCYG